jgi:hypothetical protein
MTHRIGGSVRAAAVATIVFSAVATGQGSDTKAQNELASALAAKHVSLEAGITGAAKAGKPISAKFENEGGKLQLSVYTAKGSEFFEVVVDPRTGKVAKSEKISDADDLKKAKTQNEAMAGAKQSLSGAVTKAVAENPGYSPVSATATAAGGQASAEVVLLKGHTFKTVHEPLS